MVIRQKLVPLFIALLCLTLGSNILLYHSSFGQQTLAINPEGAVVGSLVDLLIVCPILLLLSLKKMTIKQAIALIAAGCLAARFIIPMQWIAPYRFITSAGIGLELAFIALECYFIARFVRWLPSIWRAADQSTLPQLFAFDAHVAPHAKRNPIVALFSSEVLVFYYALFSWRKPVKTGITLHQKSSLMALQIMLIHAIVLESVGLHYWLHSHFPIVSIILLLFNVYGIIYLLADIQAVRHNPAVIEGDTLYISLGLTKRTVIHRDNIAHVITDAETLQQKLPARTLDFVARDFETAAPQVLLQMKTPQQATIAFFQKQYDYVAIKADDFTPIAQWLHETEKNS